MDLDTGLKIVGRTLGFLVLMVLLFVLSAQTGFLPLSAEEYEKTELAFGSCDGEKEAQLNVRIADTSSQKYVGLSRTSSLPEDEGLLFPYENDSSKQIEMRNMNFGLDIIYVSSNGTINSIESLDKPSSPVEYYLLYESVTGDGQYVIEANKGWSDRMGVTEGDCVSGLSSATTNLSVG